MQFPQLRMESNMAQISIDQKPPIQHIEQPKADISIEQPRAQIKMESGRGKLTIDQSKAWRDMGMFSPVEFMEQYGQNGLHSALEGVARRAMEGDELMRIEQGGNPIAQHGETNSYEPQKEYNIGWIPSHFAVKTHYEPGELHIDVQVNKPIINVNPQKPIHDYTPGTVNTNMKQYASLQIDIVT
nr:DUF6470 family protein [Salirhabdus salicampi]